MSLSPTQLLHLACEYQKAHGKWPKRAAVSPQTAEYFSEQKWTLFEPERMAARRLSKGCVDWHVDPKVSGDDVRFS